MTSASQVTAELNANNGEAHHPPKRPRIDYSSSVISATVSLAPSTRQAVTSVQATFSIYRDVICSRSTWLKEVCQEQNPRLPRENSAPVASKEVFQVYLDWIHAQFYNSTVSLTDLIKTRLEVTPFAKCTLGLAHYAEDWSEVSFLCMLWILGKQLEDIGFVNTAMDSLLAQDSNDAQQALCHGDDLKLVNRILYKTSPTSGLHQWAMDVILPMLTSAHLHHIFKKSTQLSAAVAKTLLGTCPKVRMPTTNDRDKYHMRRRMA